MNQIDSLLSHAQVQHHQLTDVDKVRTAIHGRGVIGSINKWLAVKITSGVGTMWCAYAFALLAAVSLPAAIKSHDPVVLVSWISQTFLQLVLLSIIIVGQQVLAEASDRRAEADHETLELLHEINVTQLQILNEIRGCVEPGQSQPPAASG
jgi:hypothetical protein